VEDFEEIDQLVELSLAEERHYFSDSIKVRLVDALEQFFPSWSQSDEYKAAVVCITNASYKTLLLKVVHDNGYVAASLEKIVRNIALRKRASKLEDLQGAELAGG